MQYGGTGTTRVRVLLEKNEGWYCKAQVRLLASFPAIYNAGRTPLNAGRTPLIVQERAGQGCVR